MEWSETEDASKREPLTYSVFSEETDCECCGRYLTYGIAVTDGEGNVLRCVHDITCDGDSLEALAALCTRLELSLCHLDDVIEDYLS